MCAALSLGQALAQTSPAATPAASARKAAVTGKSTTQAATKTVAPTGTVKPAVSDQFVDGIAAVVDKDVITLKEVEIATANAKHDLASQNIQVPDDATLRRQVLQRLIMLKVQSQEADRLGINVSNAQLDQALTAIAQRNKISVPQMRAEIEKSGVTWEAYKDGLRTDIRQDRLRQRAVDSTIVISDSEIDAYLKEQQRRGASSAAPGAAPAQAQAQARSSPARASSGSEMLALGQILVRVPENTSPADVARLRQKAEHLLAQLRQGADFAGLAASASDGPEALQGGVMGLRPSEGWPDLFLKAVQGVAPGQVSGLVQSGNGFHILKVLERRGGQASAPQAPARPPAAPGENPGGMGAAPGVAAPQGPMRVTQTRARHILIKTSTVMSDEQARQRLEQLRQRIVVGGEKFADLARQYSQDGSAPQGGDLGWLNPGETVPAFEQAMNALQPGQISQPIQTPFGWHLILVEERREHDVADEYQRMRARQALFERRARPAFEDWLEQLRDQAYVDNRLEKQQQLQQNNQ